MFGIRERLCFELSKRLIKPPGSHAQSNDDYASWRSEAIAASWSHFDNAHIRNKDVVDFGCGAGGLTLFLVGQKPKRMVGVDLEESYLEVARRDLTRMGGAPEGVQVEFRVGSEEGIPVEDHAYDTLIAFDCMEHIMEPEPILDEWKRALRPQGRVLIEWVPFKSPWGPHMEALVPIPWAHVMFGEQAMFRTCERIYDSDRYVHRSWDYDEQGALKPNKWRQWSSFREQGYINELSEDDFKALVERKGFSIERYEKHTFGSLPARDITAPLLMKAPLIHEYMTSYIIVELVVR